jgi:hypothetical protein
MSRFLLLLCFWSLSCLPNTVSAADVTPTAEVRVSPYDSTTTKVTVVSVGTSATKLPTTPLAKRRLVTVQNLGTANVYIGFGTTSAASPALNSSGTEGVALAPWGSLQLNLGPSIFVWGISGTAAQSVRVLEVL